ncbi:hypothetical protein KDI_35510 [Dictyobacter arantiisoli]|uniref:DUF1622 domain-containing protein n=2 Tax=Dictyobacter arantiisoli TaxID=2014874 RepID=A0A5A5TF68_9CHLR|nr:hypothetical protein KDI_35510 [Dictyobacter arantiisoli]
MQKGIIKLMKLPELVLQFFNFTLWASAIEFIGALLIVAYALAALLALLRTRDVTFARLLVTDGVIAGLSFKLAATLLKLVVLQTWQQILMFSVIFILRIALKRLFTWERTRIQLQRDRLSMRDIG